jgi:DNA polymerase-1
MNNSIKQENTMSIYDTLNTDIKKAMIEVDELLVSNKFNTKMILQIHDELIFEVPYDELMIVIPLIVEKMENAVNLKVKLKVDYEYGTNWYDC